MEHIVAGALAGKSIADEEVVWFHSIQLILRLKGRWSREHRHDDISDLPLGRPERTTAAPQAKRVPAI